MRNHYLTTATPFFSSPYVASGCILACRRVHRAEGKDYRAVVIEVILCMEAKVLLPTAVLYLKDHVLLF